MALLTDTVDDSIPWVYIDTGLAAPELDAFVRDFGGDRLTILRPPCHPETTWKETGRLPIGAKVSARYYRADNPDLRIGARDCCQVHKAGPNREYLNAQGCAALLIGARGDDSKRHAFKLQTGEIVTSDDGYFLSYPLLTWRRRDVLAYLDEHFPKYPLRYPANQDLGCLPCAVNLAFYPNQLSILRATRPDYYRRVIVELGFGLEILKLKYGLTEQGARDLVARDGWDSLIDSGALDKIPQPRTGWR